MMIPSGIAAMLLTDFEGNADPVILSKRSASKDPPTLPAAKGTSYSWPCHPDRSGVRNLIPQNIFRELFWKIDSSFALPSYRIAFAYRNHTGRLPVSSSLIGSHQVSCFITRRSPWFGQLNDITGGARKKHEKTGNFGKLNWNDLKCTLKNGHLNV